MTTFLVPTDFSEPAKKALFFALDLAHKAKARVLLCHVYHKSTPLLSHLPASSETARQHALEQMQGFLEAVQAAPYDAVSVDFLLKEGHIISVLSEAIAENQVALVIMGTQGANNRLERLFGTNTEALAKEGKCPVLAVPEQAALQPITQMVYATSMERDETWALQQLVPLRQLLTAQLTLLHVHSQDQLDLVDDQEIKDQLQLRFPQEELRFATVEQENVAEGIARYVETHPTHLLAITMLEQGFWDRVLQDSITVALLQRLQIPMLVLPEKGKVLNFQ